MPRWPAPQAETSEQKPAPAPSLTPDPYKPVYDYRLLNPEDAETRKYPYNGETVMVSNDPDIMGFAARWRTTRQLKGWRWVKTGAWVTPLYNTSLPFEPLCWRPLSNLEDSDD